MARGAACRRRDPGRADEAWEERDDTTDPPCPLCPLCTLPEDSDGVNTIWGAVVHSGGAFLIDVNSGLVALDVHTGARRWQVGISQ
jgi:hypothetical protein